MWLRWTIVVGIALMTVLLTWPRFRLLQCEEAIDKYGWQQAVIMGACAR